MEEKAGGNDTVEAKPTGDYSKARDGGVPTPVPGSITIRPTRTDAERNHKDLQALIEVARQSVGLSNTKVAEVVGDRSNNPVSNTSKKMSAGFSDQERRDILKHIFDERHLLSGQTREQLRTVPDALYFAFLNSMSTRETSQDNARAAILGTYKLWRFSVEHDDEFVLGKIEFTEDPKTRAVKAAMVQPKRPKDGVRGSMESFHGYFFRMSDVYLLWLRDDHNEDLRITIFPRFKFDEVGTGTEAEPGNPRSIFAGRRRHLIHLDGFGLGLDGNRGFFSPSHLSLVDDVDELARLDEELDVIPEGHPLMPQRIANKLKRNGPLRRL